MENKNKKRKTIVIFIEAWYDYAFDEHGYRTIDDLIKNHNFTMDELIYIVETNDKQRYEFNNNKKQNTS